MNDVLATWKAAREHPRWQGRLEPPEEKPIFGLNGKPIFQRDLDQIRAAQGKPLWQIELERRKGK